MKLRSIEVVADETAGSRCDEGFLRLARLKLRNHYDDGTASEAYACDVGVVAVDDLRGRFRKCVADSEFAIAGAQHVGELFEVSRRAGGAAVHDATACFELLGCIGQGHVRATQDAA